MITLHNVTDEQKKQWWTQAKNATLLGKQAELRAFEGELLNHGIPVIETDDMDKYRKLWVFTTLPWFQSNGNPADPEKIWSAAKGLEIPDWADPTLTLGAGSLYPRYIVIGTLPAFSEIIPGGTDIAFAYGKPASLLKQALYTLDILKDCWFTTGIKFPTNKKPVPKMYADCYDALEAEINAFKDAEGILALSNPVSTFLVTAKDIEIPVIPLTHPESHLFGAPSWKKGVDVEGYAMHIKMQMESTL